MDNVEEVHKAGPRQRTARRRAHAHSLSSPQVTNLRATSSSCAHPTTTAHAK